MANVRRYVPTWFDKHLVEIKKMTEAEFLEMWNGGSEQPGAKKMEFTDKEAKLVGKVARQITSKEEALEFFEVNTEEWQVQKWLTNAWGENYQVKLWLEKKNNYLEELKGALLYDIPPIDPIAPHKRKKSAKSRDIAVEVCFFDLHLGKRGFNPKTMAFNWSLGKARQVYFKALNEMLEGINLERVERFILPTGNDLINVDNSYNTTTKGTQQMAGDFWHVVFSYGHTMITDAILYLSQFAPVYVPMIPGNHDKNTTFSMGEVLKARFHGFEGVEIDNTPILRKYHRYGNNLIGFDHGEKFKAKDAYFAMSTERPEEFGECRFRFFHTGHLHKSMRVKRFDLNLKDEFMGVNIEIIPSLSPTDAWHYEHLYLGNIRRAKSFVYHKDRGLIKETYFNLEEK